MRRRRVGPAEKTELDNQLRDLRELESRLRNQLDFQMKQLDNATRSPELAQKRIALGKLSKDFEKIKASMQAISSEASSIQVTNEAGGSSLSGKFITHGSDDTRRPEGVESSSGFGSSRQKQLLLEPKLTMQGQEVDDAIQEERERDIKKMNQDLLMVNEMMRCLFHACTDLIVVK